MPPTFFTANDGDIILRAGTEPDSKHEFRVHKFILSLASPVFKDMFAFPQPPDPALNERHQPPVVDVLDPPEVLDMILRLIYPGVEPPNIADIQTLSVLLSTADKYNITSVYPVLRAALKTFLPCHPLGVYAVACRFGFLEEAKEATKAGKTSHITNEAFDEQVLHLSTTDLLRWVRFVQGREDDGREIIKTSLDWMDRSDDCGPNCIHGNTNDGEDFYFLLEKAVTDAFRADPCVGVKDLFAVLDTVPDPPTGCKSPQRSGEYYYYVGATEEFSCPLQPMTIRNCLLGIADELRDLNRRMLDEAFGKGSG